MCERKSKVWDCSMWILPLQDGRSWLPAASYCRSCKRPQLTLQTQTNRLILSRQKGCPSTSAASTLVRASRKRKISKGFVSTMCKLLVLRSFFQPDIPLPVNICSRRQQQQVAQSNLSKIIFFCAAIQNSCSTHRTLKRIKFHAGRRSKKNSMKHRRKSEIFLEVKSANQKIPLSIRKFNR